MVEKTSGMDISYRLANKADATMLIELYNRCFYDDFLSYGYCPAYDKSQKEMEQSIETFKKYILYDGKNAIGVLSYKEQAKEVYYVGCLCVVPMYQGKGIGTKTMSYLEWLEPNWREIHLITPVDKEENVIFYTKKCGFLILEKEMDEKIEVLHFVKRNISMT